MNKVEKEQREKEIKEMIDGRNAQAISDQIQNVFDRQGQLYVENQNIIAQVGALKQQLSALETKFNIVIATRGSGPTE